MRRLAGVWLVAGYVLLTVARIPDFRSDRALWLSAWPSKAPRVAANIAAALARDGAFESAGFFALTAVALSQREQSYYERAAVFQVVRNQVQWIDTFYPLCDRPDYQPYCS